MYTDYPSDMDDDNSDSSAPRDVDGSSPASNGSSAKGNAKGSKRSTVKKKKDRNGEGSNKKKDSEDQDDDNAANEDNGDDNSDNGSGDGGSGGGSAAGDSGDDSERGQAIVTEEDLQADKDRQELKAQGDETVGLDDISGVEGVSGYAADRNLSYMNILFNKAREKAAEYIRNAQKKIFERFARQFDYDAGRSGADSPEADEIGAGTDKSRYRETRRAKTRQRKERTRRQSVLSVLIYGRNRGRGYQMPGGGQDRSRFGRAGSFGSGGDPSMRNAQRQQQQRSSRAHVAQNVSRGTDKLMSGVHGLRTAVDGARKTPVNVARSAAVSNYANAGSTVGAYMQSSPQVNASINSSAATQQTKQTLIPVSATFNRGAPIATNMSKSSIASTANLATNPRDALVSKGIDLTRPPVAGKLGAGAPEFRSAVGIGTMARLVTTGMNAIANMERRMDAFSANPNTMAAFSAHRQQAALLAAAQGANMFGMPQSATSAMVTLRVSPSSVQFTITSIEPAFGKSSMIDGGAKPSLTGGSAVSAVDALVNKSSGAARGR